MSFESDTAQLASDVLKLHNIIHGTENETVATDGGAVKTVANAIKTLMGYTARGTWTPSTAYTFKDTVANAGIVYICAVSHTSGTVFNTDLSSGKWYIAQIRNFTFISDYSNSINTAVAQISGIRTTLIVDNDSVMTVDTTIPTTMELMFIDENKITLSASKTLTINGPFYCGLAQCFDVAASGSKVVFGSGSVNYVKPEWWGAKGDGLDASATLNTTAIHAALTTKKAVKFAHGEYVHNGIVKSDSAGDNYDGLTLRGEGPLKTILTCKQTGVDNIRLNSVDHYFQYIAIRDLAIKGNNSNGCGIYGNGIVWWYFDNLHVYNNGSHGIFFGGEAAGLEGGSYIGKTTSCRVYSNVGDGIRQITTGSDNQQNASYFQFNELASNTGNGMSIWGRNIVIDQNVIEGNTGKGVYVARVEGASAYSSHDMKITNNYFELNLAGHVVSALTAGGESILSLKIADNFLGSVTAGGGVADIPVTIGGALSENGISKLVYKDNLTLHVFNKELVVNCGIGPSSEVRMNNKAEVNTTTYAQIVTEAGRIQIDKTGAVNFGLKTKVLSGYFHGKGGTIVYATPGAVSNTMVSLATIYFPLDLSIGTFLRKLVMPVDTDATNWYLQFKVYSKSPTSISASTALASMLAPATGNYSGAQTAETNAISNYITTPMTLLTKANMYIELTAVITTPGTYFKTGDLTVFYTE